MLFSCCTGTQMYRYHLTKLKLLLFFVVLVRGVGGELVVQLCGPTALTHAVGSTELETFKVRGVGNSSCEDVKTALHTYINIHILAPRFKTTGVYFKINMEYRVIIVSRPVRVP